MSKRSKKKYKNFPIESIEDACLVLGTLISGVTVNLDKYKEYALEAKKLLENNAEEYISAKEYDDVNDKLLYRQREILRYTADYQDDSFSYISLRKYMEKNGYIKSELSEKDSKLLSELLDLRNWSFHNPQSLIVSEKEVIEKRIPEELKEYVNVKPLLNPVRITKISQYNKDILISLNIHTEQRISQFEHVLECMKIDYEEMILSLDEVPCVLTPNGFSLGMQYMEENITISLSDYRTDVSQVSMAIQKSKYDGTDEKYKEITQIYNTRKPAEK